MIHVYQGNGKGKTTAAMGLAVRSAGCENKVVIVQFLKGRQTGELDSFEYIPNIKVFRNEQELGFVWTMTEEQKGQAADMHNRNLRKAVELVKMGQCDLLVLDELAATYRRGLIDKVLVRELIENCPEKLELVITGREPDELFTTHADYITEMKLIRHPYEKGISARRGVEY